MAVLVTGGAGFTGSNIVRELAEHGQEVISLDIIPPDGMVKRYTEPWADRITWLSGDIADRSGLEAASAYFDIRRIVHCATYTAYGDTEGKNGRRLCDINLTGTLNMLDLARRMEVDQFIYISTAGVYVTGPVQGPLNEDVPLKLEEFATGSYGFYAITKLTSELLTRRYGHLYGFETASVRMGQNWGPVERVTPYHRRVSLPNQWVGKALRGEPIEVAPAGTGNTEGRTFGVDHPYVKDTAAAIRTMLDAPALKYPLYNISTGRPVTMLGMVDAIREAYPQVRFVEPVPTEDPTEDHPRVLDTTRMREDLGFEPRYDLVSGLRDFIQWRRDFGFLD
jgi:UDP-glucose 4-epimerase